ncbi:MAG: hypothetical protein Q9209_004570 [Squamulea sp. 1 TL-2023]
MPDLGLDARLQFLDRSARRLNGIVPATSAHLMLERNIVAEEHSKALNKSQTKDVCKACGTISIPDVTSRAGLAYPYIASSRKGKDGLTPDPTVLGAQTKIECRMCHRVIVTTSPRLRRYSPESVVNTTRKTDSSENAIVLNSTFEVGRTATPRNMSSKRRAKARKQGGLQAMLEKAKGTDLKSADTGLNLMDLMKQIRRTERPDLQ